jgi:hypothetical protein
MKGSDGSETLVGAVREAWRPMDEVRNGTNAFYTTKMVGDSLSGNRIGAVAIMLECDVNLCSCLARWSRNGGQWSHPDLHGGKVRQGGSVAVTAGKRHSIYSSPKP